MTVTFFLTPSDHFRAIRAMTWRTTGTRFAYAFFLGTPLIIVLLVLATNPEPWPFLLENWLGVVAGPAFMFLVIPALQIWTVYAHRKHNAALRSEQTYEFSADGVLMRGDLHSTQLKWELFHRVDETRHMFLFYHSKVTAHFLPKRALANAALVQQLRDLLRERLGERAQLYHQP